MTAFRVRFPGAECPLCGTELFVGQMVVFKPRSSILHHVVCPPAPAICDECHLQKPCDCG